MLEQPELPLEGGILIMNFLSYFHGVDKFFIYADKLLKGDSY
jgi:hypothetical protein